MQPYSDTLEPTHKQQLTKYCRSVSSYEVHPRKMHPVEGSGGTPKNKLDTVESKNGFIQASKKLQANNRSQHYEMNKDEGKSEDKGRREEIRCKLPSDCK